MLVYLDPSNFAHLELLRDRNPEALTHFLQRWKERDLRLALSLHHAQEVAQLADDVSRNRRLDVIRLFPKIRYAPIGSVTLRAGNRGSEFCPEETDPGGFFSLARAELSALGSFLGIPESLMLTLLPKLDPYQSPGFRLKLSVERARKRAGQRPRCGED